ncbi:hypothetical protein [Symbiobacterium thermophilum]|uniref:hypothetical protein n=1 Tax=Symbiobacterium thermophilum TaxID=2734 RepID=UPI002354D00A|nr:hypothetical protein [Symbiobacterium thermophilum]
MEVQRDHPVVASGREACLLPGLPETGDGLLEATLLEEPAILVIGTTVLVTTHYMDEAAHCDRLAMMNAGRLVAVGTPRELREAHAAGGGLEQVFVHLTRMEGAASPP